MKQSQVKPWSSNQGFTLLEVALALLITSLLLGGLLLPLSTQWQQRYRIQTREQLEESRNALYGFVLQHHRLPCPDCTGSELGQCSASPAIVNDGMEDYTISGNCAHVSGLLPRVTLGVAGRDAWGRHLSYRVSGHFADAIANGTGCIPDTLNVSFGLCSEGNIDVIGAAGTTEYVARQIPAIIISHGANGTVTTSAHETENLDGDAIFVDRDFVNDAALTFDDEVIWISPQVLKAKMVETGILP